ncbi:LamG domain-containing protein [Candidatus Poribacteria bacterium]|nr:LamG domain-containing protein [Candidatus Poribacteria bacterium]
MSITRLIIISASLFVIVLQFTAQGSAKIDPESIVGIWLFDDGKGAIAEDLSGNGNDGKLMKEPKWVDGKFGKALEFNGTDNYVDFGSGASLDITNEITIVAWTFPSNQTFNHQDIVGKPSAYILGHMDPGVIVRSYINDGGWFGVNYSKEFNNYVDKWFHFAFTYDRSELKVYVNGTLDGKGARGGAIVINKNPVVVAHSSESQGFNAFYKGVVDDIAIFNAALSEDDIKSIMSQGLSRALGMTAVSHAGKLTTTWATVKVQ